MDRMQSFSLNPTTVICIDTVADERNAIYNYFVVLLSKTLHFKN